MLELSRVSVIDQDGYRLNVGIILVNDQGFVFWGRRIGHDTWQFPQGGVSKGEDIEDTMYRELHEEIGLERDDVKILAKTAHWISYTLPKQYIRRETPPDTPKVIGQKQKWFLLQLSCSEQKLVLNLSQSPEFDSWRWIDYWQPAEEVIHFKQEVYRNVLKEFEPFVQKLRNKA